MGGRTNAVQALVAIACTALLQGCAGSGGAQPAGELRAEAPPPLDCPAARVATVTDLHTPDGLCDVAREKVGDNLKSHHYRVACETVLGGVRPTRVETVQATACRQDDRGAWTDVEICCPEATSTSAFDPAAMTAGLIRPRRMRLEVLAPAVGKHGTASVSLLPPSRHTEYRVRIAPESCDVYQLHPDRSCEAGGAYSPGETTTFMVRYTPGSTHRRGGVLVVDFVDPEASDVEVRLSGGVGDGASGWLSVPVAPQ